MSEPVHEPDVRVLYATFPDQQAAESVARELLAERLIACANLVPGVRSLYVWKGELQRDEEVVLIAKTTSERLSGAIARLTERHPYDCPCVTSWTVGAGNPAYLQWVRDEVARV